MAWSKGAVVVVKRGDTEIADAIESGLNINKTPDGRYCFLPRKHTKEELIEMIEDAQRDYGRKARSYPKWVKNVKECMAFVVYHICMFIEKYLKL